MPVSLPTVLISFSFLIDLKEMPIDEYKQTVVAREQKYTQIGNPAWIFVKCYVLAMLQLVSFQSAFIFRHLCYFL
jgi:hypothetical protein